MFGYKGKFQLPYHFDQIISLIWWQKLWVESYFRQCFSILITPSSGQNIVFNRNIKYYILTWWWTESCGHQSVVLNMILPITFIIKSITLSCLIRISFIMLKIITLITMLLLFTDKKEIIFTNQTCSHLDLISFQGIIYYVVGQNIKFR